MRLEKFTGTELSNISVCSDQTIREAMNVMTQSGLRFAPVIANADMTFAGLITDGDLRRHLTHGGALEDQVSLAVNTSPIVLPDHRTDDEVRSLLLQKGLEYLPVVIGGKLVTAFVLWATHAQTNMTAVIMAGGLGSRLSPLTDNCPKPLLEIGGKPILAHIVETLAQQGVKNFVFCVNYRAEMLQDYFDDGEELGVNISYVQETKRLGTGGALSLIDPLALSDPFLCLNGDILNDINVASLSTTHQTGAYDATMVVRRHTYQIPYGVVNTDPQGAFASAEEKPTMSYLINAGFYLLSPRILPIIPQDEFFDLPTLFSQLGENNMRGGTHLHNGRWIDIGNIDEFNRAKSIYEGSPT